MLIERVKKAVTNMHNFKVFIVQPLACEETRLLMATKRTTFFGKDSMYESFNEHVANLTQL